MGKKRLTGEQRRLQILDIAAGQFSKFGLELTRIKDIAEICGINEALIYQHFPCKDDLYHAAMEHAQTKMLMGWIEISDKSTSSLDALENLQMNRIRLIYENRDLAAVSESATLASFTDQHLQQLNAKLFIGVQNLIEDLVRKGQDDGSIRADLDAASVAYWIRGFSQLVNLAAVIDMRETLPLEKAEEHFSNLIKMLKPVAPGKKSVKIQVKKTGNTAAKRIKPAAAKKKK
jgi:AcrR family transcriptional regulator